MEKNWLPHVGEPAGAVFSGPFFLDIRGGEGRFGVRHAGRAGLAAELGEVERGVRRDGGGGTGSGRPRGRRWETGGAGRDGQCQQRAEQALFQLHGATSFLRRSGRPAGLAANKKESRFRLSIPRSGDALPCVWARFPACPGVRQVSWLEFHLLAFRLPRGYPVTEAPAWPGLPESFRPSHSSGGCRGFAPRSLFIRAAPESPERRGTVRRYSILFHRPL